MRKKLIINRQVIRQLATGELTRLQGGLSGDPCDLTVDATKCDGFGCATGAHVCLAESAQTQGNC
jgi:hypothetical protein